MKIPLVFVTLCLLWGLSYPIAKIGLQSSTPLVFTVVAGFSGLIVHLVVALGNRGPHPTGWAFHRSAIVLGIFNVAGVSAGINLGVSRVSAGESSMLIYTQPLFVGLLAWLLLGERPTVLKTLGLLAGFGGMAIVLSDRIRPGAETPLWAYGALLGASLSWTIATIYFKRIHTNLDFLWLNVYQSFYGVVLLAALALLLESPAGTDWTAGTFWFSVLFFGALASGLGRLLWFYLLKWRQASVVSAYVFLSPLVAVVSSMIILNEAIHPLVALGGALILAGIYLVNRGAGSGPPRPAATPVVPAAQAR